MSEFKTFFEKDRREAASSYVRGDAAKVVNLSAEQGTATFFDPGGHLTKGADAINAANKKGSKAFGPSSTTELEVIDQGEAGDIAFWTGYQHADMEIDGKKGQKMTLRITEVFRRQNGEWKMIHRHASKAAD